MAAISADLSAADRLPECPAVDRGSNCTDCYCFCSAIACSTVAEDPGLVIDCCRSLDWPVDCSMMRNWCQLLLRIEKKMKIKLDEHYENSFT